MIFGWDRNGGRVSSGSETMMEHGLTRRRMMQLLLGTGVAALTAGLALPGAAGAQDWRGWFQTTSDLNLRARPSRSAKVLAVMPDDARVEGLGEAKNGFVRVAYQGQGGWAHGDYLTPTNGGSADPPVIIGRARTTSAVNFRQGPSTGHAVLRVLPESTQVDVTDRSEFGFRFAYHAGSGGWLYEEYLEIGDGLPDRGYLTVTSDLNLRAEPSRSADVLRVMPTGSRVLAGSDVVNGFRRVTYFGVGNGIDGWAFDDYLA